MRVAFDLDGVLADFAGAYAAVARRLRPSGSENVSEESPEGGLERRVWRAIETTRDFWTTLDPVEPELIGRLHDRTVRGRWDTFFVTQRPPTAGDSVQLQTQRWLVAQGFPLPAVIVHRGPRGPLAAALELDFLVDDTVEHCVDVLERSRASPVFVCREPDSARQTNAKQLGIAVCRSTTGALARLVQPRIRVGPA
ncbi:MAG: hypothetical protein OXE40_09350 [Gammaproteobacteria bacterium]|nr:hypothetical protein [Gammaproteobacteria bacterium]